MLSSCYLTPTTLKKIFYQIEVLICVAQEHAAYSEQIFDDIEQEGKTVFLYLVSLDDVPFPVPNALLQDVK